MADMAMTHVGLRSRGREGGRLSVSITLPTPTIIFAHHHLHGHRYSGVPSDLIKLIPILADDKNKCMSYSDVI